MRGTAESARIAVFVLIASSITAGGLRAQDPPAEPDPDSAPLTLHQAVSEALDFYPSVRASQAVSDAAHATLGQAKSARWPEIGLAGSLTQHQEPMIVTPIHAFTPGETPAFDETLIQGGGYLSFVLFDGGARRARVGSARGEAFAAAADLGAARQTLVVAVAGAYVEVLTGREVLAAHDRQVAAIEAELDRVRQLRGVGRAALLEVLRAEAVLASAQSDRVGVAAALDMWERELARLIGEQTAGVDRRELAPVTLVEDSLPSRGSLIARASAANPELEAARRRQTAARALVSLARSARWPRLELTGSWVDRGGIDSGHTAEWAAGAQIAFPLFTGGRIGQEISRAEAGARGADERIRLASTETERAVDRAVSLIEETDSRARSLETAAASSEEVVRIELLRLETETGTQTDYLDAEAALLTVRAALAQIRHARVLARIQLARALGELTPDWLAQNVGAER